MYEYIITMLNPINVVVNAHLSLPIITAQRGDFPYSSLFSISRISIQLTSPPYPAFAANYNGDSPSIFRYQDTSGSSDRVAAALICLCNRASCNGVFPFLFFTLDNLRPSNNIFTFSVHP
ncbi:hypothetical protein Droror1_Dr00003102 [Drosera rotundifolia]